MTEKSWYWPGTTTGDASDAPYDDDEFSDIWRKLFQRDRTLQGIIDGYESELSVSSPSTNVLRVAKGAALVDGKFYEADDVVDKAFATPSVLLRIDRVVLRKDFAAQTVRVAILTGVEGGGVPALTQVDGVTWEIPLAQADITIVPTVTLTNERQNVRTPLAPDIGTTMRKIATVAGDGAITTFDFPTIPTFFDSLLILGTARIDTAVLEANLQLRFNDDSAVNYSWQKLLGSNAAASAIADGSETEIDVGLIPGASADANHVGQFEIRILGHQQAIFYKTLTSLMGHIPNTGPVDFDVGLFTGLWRDTSPITRITLLNSSGGALVTGVSATLYGLT